MPKRSLAKVAAQITACNRCTRLRTHCLKIAETKKRAHLHETYWGKPVSGFGDPHARLMIVGLAPAAHGANRTGRIFTGDRSGEWLYGALYRAGFSNQPQSLSREDALQLKDVYITCVARCAPPENKPTPEEIQTCLPYLQEEMRILNSVKIYLALGQIGLSGLWKTLQINRARPRFGHGEEATLPDGRIILMSYHPSQQNTFTGRLTQPMWDGIFSRAKEILSASS